MGLRDAHPDATVPAVRRFPLPDPRPADAIRQARRVSDASVGAHPDGAADAVLPALAAVRYAEKLAAREQVVPAPDAKAHRREQSSLREVAKAPCTRGAVRSAA
jgi:hypothetical protein